MEGYTAYGRPFTSVFTPIADNPDFLPGAIDSAFQRWAAKGISSLGDLFVGPTLMSFNQVVEKYGISRNDLFCYFQVRDFLIKLCVSACIYECHTDRDTSTSFSG